MHIFMPKVSHQECSVVFINRSVWQQYLQIEYNHSNIILEIQ